MQQFVQFLFDSAVFLFGIGIFFYLPGHAVSYLFKLPLLPQEKPVFATVLGLVVFTLIAYIFDSLSLPRFIVPAILALDSLVLWDVLAVKKQVFKKEKQQYYPHVLLLGMALLFCIPMITSGQFGQAIRFMGVNGTDSYWHISLINELSRHFPPQDPGLSGTVLKNYHFFFDYVLAKFHANFYISPLLLYFQLFPPFIAILWAYSVYLLVRTWTKNTLAAGWAVFFTFFGGSFAFLLPLVGVHGTSLNSAFGMLQPTTSLINPPFATSIVILIIGLFALYRFIESKHKGWIAPLVILFGLISEFKVYGGIAALGGLSIFIVWKLIRRQYIYGWILGGIALLFFTTYWRFSGNDGSLFWQPLWAPRDILRSTFPDFHYDLKVAHYKENNSTFHLIYLDILAFVIYFFGNLGVRVLALAAPASQKMREILKSEFSRVILIMVCVSFFVPLFFIQSIKAFETTQIFNYFLFFLSLVTAMVVAEFTMKIRPWLGKAAFGMLLVVLSVPHVLADYRVYWPILKTNVPTPTVAAAAFLKNTGTYESVLLVMPEEGVPLIEADVKRWYLSQTNHMIAALSQKRSYLSNSFYNFPGGNIDERVSLVYNLFVLARSLPDSDTNFEAQQSMQENLKANNIHYLWSSYPLERLTQELGARQVFDNGGVFIYEF